MRGHLEEQRDVWVELVDDLDDAGDSIVQLIVPAAGLPPPSTRGVRWGFELPKRATRRSVMPPELIEAANDSARFGTTERQDGVLRCVGAHYPANRWTPERQMLEEERRARQRPPRPTKRYLRKGRKLDALVGPDI